MLKKLLIAVIAPVMMFVLVGCGAGDGGSNNGGASNNGVTGGTDTRSITDGMNMDGYNMNDDMVGDTNMNVR